MKALVRGAVVFGVAWFLTCAAFLAGAGADDTMPEAGDRDSRMETIVTTLNQTLSENKNLRAEMDRVREAIRILTVENSFLRAEMRRKPEVDPAELQEEREARGAAVRRLGEVGKTAVKLAGENHHLRREKRDARKRIGRLQRELVKLREWLEVLLSEEERKRYVRPRPAGGGPEEVAVRAVPREKVRERIEGELGSLYYSLGNLFFEQRDYPRAVEKYRKALTLNPRDAWAHHNLAIIYDYYLNDDGAAVFHYEKYLGLKPEQEDGHPIEERVLQLQLETEIVPKSPLKKDFDAYHRQRGI